MATAEPKQRGQSDCSQVISINWLVVLHDPEDFEEAMSFIRRHIEIAEGRGGKYCLKFIMEEMSS